MSISLKFYADAGLSIPLTELPVVQASDGSTGAQDFIVYLGSIAVGKKFQTTVNPGGNHIFVTPTDAASGAGVAASAIKLALTNGALAAAPAGAARDLGVTQILSGAANAKPVHMRVNAGALSSGTYVDLSLVVTSCVEVSV